MDMLTRCIKLIKAHYFLIFFFSLFLILVYFSILHPVLPVNQDEAANYIAYSSQGPLNAVTKYDQPNNHIFFTLLQSIFVQRIFLVHFPLEIRLLNCVFGALLLFLICFLSLRLMKKRKSIAYLVVFSFCLLFASPLVTPYFIEARGYLLGTILLFLGIYCLSTKRFMRGSLLFAFAIWTIPTFLFPLPLCYLLAFILYGKKYWKKIFISGILLIVYSSILYAPAFPDLITVSFSRVKIYGYSYAQNFFPPTFFSISNLSYLPYGTFLNTVFFLTYLFSLFKIFKSKNITLKRFILFLPVSIVSYVISVFIIFHSGHANAPYLRNGLFIPLFISLTILIAGFICKKRWEKFLLFGILFVNTAAGMYFFVKLANFERNFTYPVFEENQRLTSKALLEFIYEKNPKFIITDNVEDYAQVIYYSYVYAIPIKEKISIKSPTVQPKAPGTHAKTPSTQPKESRKAVLPRKEPSPFLLPSNPLYPLKRLWQYVSLKSIESSDPTMRRRIEYLLSRSDGTYAEADALWKKEDYDLAVKTFARSENDMTLAAGNINIFFSFKNTDKEVIYEMKEATMLHQNILRRVMRSKKGKGNKQISDIYNFSKRNLQTVEKHLSP